MIQAYVAALLGAAPPQKLLLLGFLGIAVVAVLMTVAGRPRPAGESALFGGLAVACPLLGLGAAALNAVHMMQTSLRLPVEPTLRMLAPGYREMAVLVFTGCLAGLACLLVRRSAERPGR